MRNFIELLLREGQRLFEVLYDEKERIVHDLQLFQELGIFLKVVDEHLKFLLLYSNYTLWIVIFVLGFVVLLYLLQYSIKCKEIYIF